MSLKKLCGRSGCSQVIDYGLIYCCMHQAEFEDRQRERHKEYKQQRDDRPFIILMIGSGQRTSELL